MTGKANSRRIIAVILAAGASRRFGRPKQLESVKGETLVARAVRVARESCGEDVVLIVGHAAPEIIAAAGSEPPEILANAKYADGIGTSLATAATELGSRADALLVILADQPRVTSGHLDQICGAWSGAPGEIVATNYGNAAGPPVLLPRGTFADLSDLTGDTGARALFDDARFELRTIYSAEAELDVDTPEDLLGVNQPDA